MQINALHTTPRTLGDREKIDLKRRVRDLEKKLAEAVEAIRNQEWMLGELQQKAEAQEEQRQRC
jgi:hypothetical protein